MKFFLIISSFVVGSGILTGSGFEDAKPVNKKPENKKVKAEVGPIGEVSIVIDKSDYELSVYDSRGWYATYPVVFGNNSLADKRMEGDKNTPEGNFSIILKKLHNKWCRFLAIDYPNAKSREKFNMRKQNGEIPINAKIGGSIGIHGTWPHEDFVVDRFKNWTDGCIAMKNEDVRELYQFTKTGTQVTIRK